MDSIHSWIDKKEVDDFVDSLGVTPKVGQQEEVLVSEKQRQEVKSSLVDASQMAAKMGLLGNSGLQKKARIGAAAKDPEREGSQNISGLNDLLLSKLSVEKVIVFDRDGDVLYFNWDGNLTLVNALVTTIVNSFLFNGLADATGYEAVRLNLASGRYAQCISVMTLLGQQCVAFETDKVLSKEELAVLAAEVCDELSKE